MQVCVSAAVCSHDQAFKSRLPVLVADMTIKNHKCVFPKQNDSCRDGLHSKPLQSNLTPPSADIRNDLKNQKEKINLLRTSQNKAYYFLAVKPDSRVTRDFIQTWLKTGKRGKRCMLMLCKKRIPEMFLMSGM